jgi:hypothetical protein
MVRSILAGPGLKAKARLPSHLRRRTLLRLRLDPPRGVLLLPPPANPRDRKARHSTFQLPLPKDRASIQLSIGLILQGIATNQLDPRRAGLLLYGLQIASTNLPPTRTSPLTPSPSPSSPSKRSSPTSSSASSHRPPTPSKPAKSTGRTSAAKSGSYANASRISTAPRPAPSPTASPTPPPAS